MTKMECSVCWNTTEDKLTPCSHPLCNSCAERWLPKSITCPICRKTVVAAALDTPSDARVVVDGKCVTSQGPGTAIEFGLKLAELLVSKEKADEVAKAMLMP